jgi:hypothetical protein
MTNECEVVELYGNNCDGRAVSRTCASGTTILKGTLTVLSNPRTVTAAGNNLNGLFGGVVAADKDGSDSSTEVTVWTDGVFTMAASSTINAGADVVLSTVANYVEASTTLTVFAKRVGTALSTASGGLVDVRVNI